jgi:hypothetical protein
MALRTPPSWLQQGSHPAENDRLTAQALWKTTGIVNSTDLQITQSVTPAMTVLAAAGYAVIIGTTQTNMGAYMAYNDGSVTLTLTAANPTLPRIDLVCMTVNDAYYTGATNNVVFQVIAGTPNASPVAPTLPANSITLARIAVAANATSIVNANITDTRVSTTTSVGLNPSGSYTVAGLTSTGNIIQTGTNSIGSLPDTLMAILMGAM